MIDLGALTNSVRHHEGVVKWVYLDSRQVSTIGIGRNVDKAAGGPGLRDIEMAFMLQNDLLECDKRLRVLFPWYMPMSAARCNAICEMFFQLGEPKFLGYHKMIAALTNGDYKTAAAECLDSQAAREEVTRFGEYAKAIEQG